MTREKYGIVEGETAENVIKTASDEIVEKVKLSNDKKESSSNE
jgi:hypothetical protein